MTRDRYFNRTTNSILIFLALMMLYLFSGLFRSIDLPVIVQIISDGGTVQAVLVSLMSICVSMVVVAFLGTVLAYKLCGKEGRIFEMLNALIILPLLLPPTVAGLVLLQGFGRFSLVSRVLFGGQLNMAFNFTAIVVTQVYVTLPFFYQMTLNAFEDIDRSYIEAAMVCGADRWVMLKDIMIPMSIRAMGA